MPSHKDSKIEDNAFDFLDSYYSKRKKNSGLLVSKQAPTKRGAQVDGLFTYRKEDNTFFAASLSVKQSDDISKLLNNYRRHGLGKARFFTATLLLLGTALAGYATGNWVLLWVLPPFLALAGFLAHSLLAKHHLQQRLTKAVEELKKYPADEQWLGVSVSSLCFKNNALATTLSELCSRRGIGLITVGKRARLTLRQEPRQAKCRREDFLAYYTAEEAIRKNLADQFMRVA